MAVAAIRGPRSLRVLLVEDYPDVREMFALYLSHAGMEITTAPDGPAAVTLLESSPPDVVVVDLGLPGVDGWELIGRMRASSTWRDVGIVAFTGYVQDVPLARAREAGADLVLTKPAGPQTLADAIATVHSARLARRARSSPPPHPT